MNAATGLSRRSTLQAPARGAGAWSVRIVAVLRNLGPYAAIELLLPGGSLLALLLWLYRRHQRIRSEARGSRTAPSAPNPLSIAPSSRSHCPAH